MTILTTLCALVLLGGSGASFSSSLGIPTKCECGCKKKQEKPKVPSQDPSKKHR